MMVARAPPASRADTDWGAIVSGTSTKSARSLTTIRPIATTRNANATAIPPPRGTGDLLTRRWSGVSIASSRTMSRRTTGVTPTAISIATTNVTMRSGSTSPNVGISRIGSGGVPRQPRDREARDELAHVGADPVVDARLVAVAQRVDDHPADLAHLVRAEAAGGRGRRPDPDPARDVGRVLVERDRVLVDGDPDIVEERLGVAAGDAERRDVDQREVVVGAPADQPGPGAGNRLREDLGVLHRPHLGALEVIGHRELERHGLGGDHVHQRP